MKKTKFVFLSLAIKNWGVSLVKYWPIHLPVFLCAYLQNDHVVAMGILSSVYVVLTSIMKPLNLISTYLIESNI